MIKHCPFLFFLFLFVLPLKGQDSIIALDEVILKVEASKVNPLGDIPSEVLTSRAIALNNPTDFAGTINMVPGVYFLSGALNTNRITIRGVGARTLFGTDKLRMYYNDIPVTDGTGTSTLEAFDLENLSAIRVVKGPKAGNYGAALGGAILLNSQNRGPEGFRLWNRSVTGSYGLFKNNLGLQYGDSLLRVTLRYNRLTTNGYRENNYFDRDGLLLDLSYKAGKRHELGVLVNHIDYRAGIPSSLSLAAFEEDPTQAAFTWAQSRGFEANRYTLAGLSDRITLGKGLENTTSIFVSYLDHYEPRPFNILDEYTLGYGLRSVFRGRLGSGNAPGRFELGVEQYRDEYAWSTFENLYRENEGQGGLQGSRLSRNREFRNYAQWFGRLELPLATYWRATASLALNKTRYTYRDLFNTGAANQSGERDFDPIILPGITLRYDPGTGSYAYVNASRGFNNPSLEESLTPDGLINPEISQEKGMNYELGGQLELLQRALQIRGALYWMEIEDLLVADRVGEDQFIGRNAGATRHRGLELSAEYRQALSPKLRINPFISYTLNAHRFQDFVDGDDDFSGNPLTGVPRNRVYGGLRFDTPAGGFLSLTWQYVDPIPLTDANTLNSEAYQLVNLQAGHSFNFLPKVRARLDFGINNLGNRRYASSVLINAGSFNGSAPRYFYPGNARNYFISLRLDYGG